MSNSRNLSKLSVDSNGDIAAASLDNVPPSDDASALTTGTLDVARIADASLTAAKLASGAAASNLGNYVTTVNGSTGAVTVQPTLVSGTNIKTINSTSLLGSGDITVGSSTDFNAVGTYVLGWWAPNSNSFPTYGGTISVGSGTNQMRAGVLYQDANGGNFQVTWTSGVLSGTWRLMGGSGYTPSPPSFYNVSIFVRVS